MTAILRLNEISDHGSVKHRMLGRSAAEKWSRQQEPPTGADEAGYYAAALEGTLDAVTRAAVSRCLLWCHAETRTFDPARRDWYREVALANPDDERCAFFLATLCRQGTLDDPALAERAYHSVLRLEWADSRCWRLFELSRVALTGELALLSARSEEVTPERLARVEAAYRRPGARPDERAQLTAYLAHAYRVMGRADNDALTVFTLRFNTTPTDRENVECLARLCAARERRDATACATYEAMVRREAVPGEWTVRAARTYVAVGRVGEEALPTLRAAAAIVPGDAEIVAALAWCGAQATLPDREARRELEAALRRESDTYPVFVKRKWEWGRVLRAVAHGWSVQGRLDEEARALYTRALALCRDDDGLVIAQARLLADAGEHTAATIPVYARALAALRATENAPQAAEDALVAALGRACLNGAAPETARPVWEHLYRRGQDWPELRRALAYLWAETGVTDDAALALWRQVIAEEPADGMLRIHLGRALQTRGENVEALQRLREGARLCPTDVAAHRETGRLLLQNGDPYSAEIWLRAALALDETDVAAHLVLGEALLTQGRRNEARAVFEEVARRWDPGNPDAILRIAQLSRKETTAGRESPPAGDGDPDDPESCRELAARYRGQKQDDEEEQALLRLLELAPGDADAGAYLAENYLRRGDCGAAERILRQIVGAGTADKRVFTLLGELIARAYDQAA